jgi:ferredoxin
VKKHKVIKLKVFIKEGCIKCGICSNECPEVFTPGPDEIAIISEGYQGDNEFEGEVGDKMAECVKAAENACPVHIISTKK